LRAARYAWAFIAFATVFLFLIATPDYVSHQTAITDRRVLEDLGIAVGSYVNYTLGLNLIVVLVHNLIAAIIYWRKHDDWMALFVAFTLVANGAIIPLSVVYSPGGGIVWLRGMVDLVITIGLASSVTILYLFPDGRFVPGWTRYLAFTWILFIVAFMVGGREMAAFPSLLQVTVLLISLIWSVSGLLAQIYRYQAVSRPDQRQQTKWAVLGLAAAVLGPFQYIVPFVILPAVSGTYVPNILFNRVGPEFFAYSFLLGLGFFTALRAATLLFPLSFAMAILRHRLWEIDVIINRTLVYGALSGTLVAIYFVSVVLLQRVFPVESELAVVFSTLMIAGLFTPLRRQIQEAIDRRFYRRKYDVGQTLSQFGSSVRDQVDLETLSIRLLDVVQETMQPDHTSLWLRKRQ
jgi:hypothetical protein